MSSPVEQIKSRLNIVDVVQSYVKLQKAGVNFKANCPFHSEKTPSFFVSPTRETWHCFGCNRGGDIFSFVMEIEGIEFVEALRILAGRAGVELKPVDPKQRSERERLLNLMESAKNFYESELKKNSEALAYLKDRGLKDETIKNFNIGFAPAGWRNLYDFLKNKGYSDSEIEKAGMTIRKSSVASSQSSDYYDRFRSRIMFPLANSSGQTVGFSGRIFGEDSKMGKYINTPQTVLYDKSRILYGFEKAKNEIRKNDACILVEGQMDVIMSHQAGFANTVAVSGTALTNSHLEIIKRLTENIIMAFDKDDAGIAACGRGIDMALAQGFEVKIAAVPSGKDPADAIKENPKEWKKSLDGAKNAIEFYLDLLKDRKQIAKIVLPYIFVLPSEIEKAHWVGETAKRLGVKEESVWEELKKVVAPKDSPLGIQTPLGIQKGSPLGIPKKNTRLQLIKNRLLGFIIWQCATEDSELKKAIAEIVEKRKFDLEKAKQSKTADHLVLEAELFYYNCEGSLKDEFGKLALELEKEELKSQLAEITDKMREFEIAGNTEKLKDSLEKFYELTKKLNELK